MKKISFLLILILGLSLCSCGTSSSTEDNNKVEKVVKNEKSHVTAYVAADLLDLTFAEVKNQFGNEYDIPEGGYNGATIVTYKEIPFAFAFPFSATGKISDDEVVGGVYVKEGGFVTDKIKVGMTFKEIEKNYDSPIEIGEDSDTMGDMFCAINLGDTIAIFSAESENGKTYSAMLKYTD